MEENGEHAQMGVTLSIVPAEGAFHLHGIRASNMDRSCLRVTQVRSPGVSNGVADRLLALGRDGEPPLDGVGIDLLKR